MDLKSAISNLPKKPGVYQFYSDEDKIIYVGKAKSLKNRVSSYFTNDKQHSAKTRVLVKNIVRLEYIVVDTEFDALLLENTLIKKYQPRYNIQLKDDKTYPWIVIKNEPFPRVYQTRTVAKDKSQYFGPYTSVKMVRILLDVIKKTYPLRNCTLNLTDDNIKAGKFKVCLEYHLGNCLGPCVGKQTRDNYNESILSIRKIVKGNLTEVISELKYLMNVYAEELDFEKAQVLKENLESLQRYKSKSTVVSATINNVDVFSILLNEKHAYVNFLKVSNGAIIQSHTIEMKARMDETETELLTHGIIDIRTKLDSKATDLILPFDLALGDLKVTVPQRGDKKALLDLSQRNAKFYMLDRKKEASKRLPNESKNRVLGVLQADLRLKELPTHIECFDNSNIQGTHPVAACVVFKNGKPAKRDYRNFNIKTVVGPDDFASMEEVVYRRYKRLKEENQPLPQIIIIDGGKGQLSSAVKSLKALDLYGTIAIVGIAKKLEEIYFPGDPFPLHIDKRSESLKLIQHLRNEAHRFGITHHRNRRSKASITSELDEIKGVGDKSKQALLTHFKSVKRIKEASLAELENVISKSIAQKVLAYFK